MSDSSIEDSCIGDQYHIDDKVDVGLTFFDSINCKQSKQWEILSIHEQPSKIYVNIIQLNYLFFNP